MVFSYSVILIRLGQFFNESLHHWLRPAAHKAQPLKESRVVNEFGRVGSQGVTRVSQAVFTRLMQIQVWCPTAPAGCVKSGINTRTVSTVPPALSFKPHNSISPHMSIASFELLSLHRGLGC